eukprot:gene7542-13326_t
MSCFFKEKLLDSQIESCSVLITENLVFHVELHQVYFGSNIEKVKQDPAFTGIPASARQEVLQKCRDSLVTLAKELKKRLPINGTMHGLRFLKPQVAVPGEIGSIVPLLENFPNIIEPKLHQELDMQWRQLAMDS